MSNTRVWRLRAESTRRSPASLLGAAVVALAIPVKAEIVEHVWVTATRDVRENQNIASSIGRIDAQTISQTAHTHIEEVAGRVPGVWISRGNGQEHLTAIRSGVLTGPGSCGAFYMAEDGIPLRAPGFCNVNQLFDTNTEQAGAVEILRGPGTAVHGSNAVNGVINVLGAMPDGGRSELRLERGRHNYRRALLDHNGDNLRFTANATSDGGFKEQSGFEQQKLTVRHVHEGDIWTRTDGLSASNLNQETAGFVQGDDAYKERSRRDENPNPEAFRDTTSVRLFSRLSRTVDGDRKLVLTPFARYTEMQFLQHFLPGTPLEENRHYSVGLQSAIYQMTRAGQLHYGLDIDLTRGSLEQSQTRATFGPFPTGNHYDYSVDSTVAGIFAGMQIDIDPATSLDADVRYEFQKYRYDNHMSSGNLAADGSACPSGTCRYARPADRNDTFNNLSASLGVVHAISESQDLVARIAQGFRAPEAAELYRLQANQLSADLDSEELTSLEVGLRNRWQDVRLNVVAYWMEKNNVIIQDADRRNLSDGKTRHRGIEIDGRLQATDTIAISAQASFARHQYANEVLPDRLSPSVVLDVEGNDLDTAPRQTGAAQIHWQPRAQTSVELEWRYMGPYYLDALNSRRYDGHTLVNLRWREDLGRRFFIGARLINLEDTSYAERADFAFGNERYFIGEPRSLYGEFGIRFD